MLFRFTGERRRSVDMEDTFSGTCFLVGGAPSLTPYVDKLNTARVPKLVMNNTAVMVRPTLWIGGDAANYYSSSILFDQTYPKFVRFCKRDNDVQGRKWRSLGSTYFMWLREDVRNEHFFTRSKFLSWDKEIIRHRSSDGRSHSPNRESYILRR